MSKRDHAKGGAYIDPFAFLPRAGGIARQIKPTADAPSAQPSAQPISLLDELDSEDMPTPTPTPTKRTTRKKKSARKGKRALPGTAKGKTPTAPKARARASRASTADVRIVVVACKVSEATSAALNKHARALGATRSTAAARLLADALDNRGAKVPRAPSQA